MLGLVIRRHARTLPLFSPPQTLTERAQRAEAALESSQAAQAQLQLERDAMAAAVARFVRAAGEGDEEEEEEDVQGAADATTDAALAAEAALRRAGASLLLQDGGAGSSTPAATAGLVGGGREGRGSLESSAGRELRAQMQALSDVFAHLDATLQHSPPAAQPQQEEGEGAAPASSLPPPPPPRRSSRGVTQRLLDPADDSPGTPSAAEQQRLPQGRGRAAEDGGAADLLQAAPAESSSARPRLERGAGAAGALVDAAATPRYGDPQARHATLLIQSAASMGGASTRAGSPSSVSSSALSPALGSSSDADVALLRRLAQSSDSHARDAEARVTALAQEVAVQSRAAATASATATFVAQRATVAAAELDSWRGRALLAEEELGSLRVSVGQS